MGLFLQRMRQRLVRPVFRRMAAMVVDATIVIESFAVALLFRFEGDVLSPFWGTFWPFAIFAALAFVLLLYWSGVYQSTLRYSGIYQDVQQGEALVVPRWVLRVASATALAAGGAFYRGLRGGRNPEPQAGSALGYPRGGSPGLHRLVAVRHVPRVFNTS
jgi:hypothetical protein